MLPTERGNEEKARPRVIPTRRAKSTSALPNSACDIAHLLETCAKYNTFSLFLGPADLRLLGPIQVLGLALNARCNTLRRELITDTKQYRTSTPYDVYRTRRKKEIEHCRTSSSYLCYDSFGEPCRLRIDKGRWKGRHGGMVPVGSGGNAPRP
jgi:hypothetical protein